MTTNLIAEDTGDIRDARQRLFTRAGSTIVTAADGCAVLQLGGLPW